MPKSIYYVTFELRFFVKIEKVFYTSLQIFRYILKAKTEKDNVGASSPKAASKVKYLKSKDGAKSTAEEQKLTVNLLFGCDFSFLI